MFGIRKQKSRSQRIKLNYDQEHDILYIVVGKPVPSYSDEENLKGLYIRRSMDNDKVTGATIMDYSKRNPKVLKKHIPFEVELSN